MTTKPRQHSGLSPSGLALYSTCARKFAHKYKLKTPVDSDVVEDYEAFEVGKAFHQVLENTRHNVAGIKYAEVFDTVATFKVEDPNTAAPMIFAMLSKYRQVFEKMGLEVAVCEMSVETETFYGIVDVVFKEKDSGKWWIGDLKTAASFSPALIPTLPRHPQLNLYAAHADLVAYGAGLNPSDFQGCRYLLTTKSRLIRKKTESLPDYISRLSKSVRSYDFKIPKEKMHPVDILRALEAVKVFTSGAENLEQYPQVWGSCNQWNRPCEYFSRCHGGMFSELQTIEVIQSE